MIPTEDGARTNVLTSKDIENLALVGRDTTELLKVLPGATTMSSGLTNNSPAYSDLNTGVQQSAVGNGININGAVIAAAQRCSPTEPTSSTPAIWHRRSRL